MPDDLYGLPLEEFIAARDASARALRKSGDRETAATVAKLPKPTPAAWAANQVARTHPELIDALLDAGAALRAAQDAAFAGDAAGLREATLDERHAIDAVMTAAVSLRPAGKPLSRPMADRLRTTLGAAARDEAIRAALKAGRLVTEAEAGGAWPFATDDGSDDVIAALGASLGGGGKSGGSRGARAKAGDAAAAGGDADTAAEEERRAEAERAQRRKALEAELREARGALRVHERVAAGAREDAEAARDALDAARRALEEATAEAESAERVAAEADAALARARDDVAQLEERID